jgi:small subunit ribosomal protein S16
MLKIRLRRMGNRHRAFFRVVVSDSRRTPTSSALEEIGYYDPKKDPAVVEIDLDRFDHWMGLGAQASNTVRNLVDKLRANGEAPAAKATEEPKAEKAKTEEPKAEEAKAEEPKAEEAQAEEPKAEEAKAEAPPAEASEAEASGAPA